MFQRKTGALFHHNFENRSKRNHLIVFLVILYTDIKHPLCSDLLEDAFTLDVEKTVVLIRWLWRRGTEMLISCTI